MAMIGEKIELLHTEKIGRRMLAITKCPKKPDSHCFEWTKTDEKKRTDGTGRITFLCTACRSLRDGKKVAKDTPVPSLIAIRGTNEEICWAGEGNGNNHCCAGSKERIQVTARAIKRSMGAELAVGSTQTATSAVTRLEGKVLNKVTDADGDARKSKDESDVSSGSNTESDEEKVNEIEPLMEDEEDAKELLSFVEEKGMKTLSPPLKKPRLDSPEVLQEFHVPLPTYPWKDEPSKIKLIKGDNNCFYRCIAFLEYKDEEEHERVRREMMEFLLCNKQHSWIKYFGGADGVYEYARKFSRLGEWGSSMQLILASKLYNTNFILYQPHQLPLFVPFFVDKDLLTGSMELRVGFIRFQGFSKRAF